MSNPPLTLREIGEALFGPTYQNPLRGEINVGERTMREWQRDDAQLPPGLVDELRELCERRGQALLRIAAELPQRGIAGIPGYRDEPSGNVQTQVYSHMRKPGERRKL